MAYLAFEVRTGAQQRIDSDHRDSDEARSHHLSEQGASDVTRAHRFLAEARTTRTAVVTGLVLTALC
jgi:hypothetical protein